jgi:biopolymer transport protein ExbB
MWILFPLMLVAQADDILADESKSCAKAAPAAATAPADAGLPPAAMPETSTESKTGKAEGKEAEAASEEPVVAEGAEAGDAAAEEKGWLHDVMHSGAMGYMLDGGLFMWPLLFLGVLALGVIIERYRALMMLNTKNETLRTEVRRLLERDQVEEALNLCDREQGPVPAILGAGLRKYLIARRLGYDAGKIEEQVNSGMDDYSVHIVAAMEKHLPVLATVSSAAPMIGFLGTVQGMVVAFANIVELHGKVDIVLAAAEGIMISLLTTVLGLIVGIPAFIAFNYFNSVINRFVLEVQESAAELIEAVTFRLALEGKEQEDEASAPEREAAAR